MKKPRGLRETGGAPGPPFSRRLGLGQGNVTAGIRARARPFLSRLPSLSLYDFTPIPVDEMRHETLDTGREGRGELQRPVSDTG